VAGRVFVKVVVVGTGVTGRRWFQRRRSCTSGCRWFQHHRLDVFVELAIFGSNIVMLIVVVGSFVIVIVLLIIVGSGVVMLVAVEVENE
jgi:hypothetical protein